VPVTKADQGTARPPVPPPLPSSWSGFFLLLFPPISSPMASLMLLSLPFFLGVGASLTTSALSSSGSGSGSGSGSVSLVRRLDGSLSSTRLCLRACEPRRRRDDCQLDRLLPSPRRSESATTALRELDRGVRSGAGVSRAMLWPAGRTGVRGGRRVESALGGLAVLLDFVGVSGSSGSDGVRRRIEDRSGRLGPVVAGV
jgi:hypothetical protein